MRTPKRPTPAAYISLGLLIAVALSPVATRITTAALDIRLGRPINTALFIASTILLTAAGGYGAYLIVKFFRALRAEDRAEQQAEVARLRAEQQAEAARLRAEQQTETARLQAEAARLRAEAELLHRRMEELEEREWWGPPRGETNLEDTADLSNVHLLPKRQFPESRSS